MAAFGNIAIHTKPVIYSYVDYIPKNYFYAPIKINPLFNKSLEEREASFKDLCFKNAAEFADAGFFYAGYSDRIQCFSCGVSFENWSPDIDIWTEHAHYFPGCYHLKTKFYRTYTPSENIRVFYAEPTDSELISSLDKTNYEYMIGWGYEKEAILGVLKDGIKHRNGFTSMSSFILRMKKTTKAISLLKSGGIETQHKV